MLKYQTGPESKDYQAASLHNWVTQEEVPALAHPLAPYLHCLGFVLGLGGGGKEEGCGCLNKANGLCVEEGTCKTIEAYAKKKKNTDVQLCAEGRY